MYYMEQMPNSVIQGDIKQAKVFRVCHVKGGRKTPENTTIVEENLTMDEANALKNVLNAEESRKPIDDI